MERAVLSVCMIVRDEADKIEGILRDCLGFADEIVVVDTGSVDDTKDIVRQVAPGAVLLDFPWVDDFSAARNFSIDHATGDHIMILDADDRVDPGEMRKFLELLSPDAVWTFNIRSGPDAPFVPRQVRCFPNRSDLRYLGRVHNEIMTPILAIPLQICDSGIAIRHSGYDDPSVVAKKWDRTMAILEREFLELPDDDRVNVYLGQHLEARGRPREAHDCYLRVVASLESIEETRPWGLLLALPGLCRTSAAMGNREEAFLWWKRYAAFVVPYGPDLSQEVITMGHDLGFLEMAMRGAA
jgi:glycosyltransferase involved in cell wall biosynthesis